MGFLVLQRSRKVFPWISFDPNGGDWGQVPLIGETEWEGKLWHTPWLVCLARCNLWGTLGKFFFPNKRKACYRKFYWVIFSEYSCVKM